MSNTLYNYYDTDFNLSQAGNYTLLLLVAANHFSAAVVGHNRVLAWIKQCPVDELLNPNELNGLLNARYELIVAGVATTKFTLWPSELFEQQQTTAIARLLNTEATDTVITSRVDEQNMVVYLSPQTVTRAIKKYGWEQQTVFGAKGFIKAITAGYPSEQSLYINVNAGLIDILYLKDNRVRFFNTFRFNNTDELVYFTLLAAQELGLDLTTTYIKASGGIDAGDPCISRLAEFFKGAELNTLQLMNLPEAIPSHQILGLSALTLCESSVEV